MYGKVHRVRSHIHLVHTHSYNIVWWIVGVASPELAFLVVLTLFFNFMRLMNP